jgi:orotate phosphoribosyltransferase
LISLPEARNVVVNAFIEELKSLGMEADYFSGTATAGIPWAAFVAERMEKPMLYVRSKPKEHGAGKMVEGRGEKNKKIVVIEDALSTAGSSIVSVQALRDELEAEVRYILAIFSWDTPEAPQKARAANVKLKPLTMFSEIVEALLVQKKITAEEKSVLEKFHKDPKGWRS